MRFAPQRRAIFGHLNFKKCSDTVSFLAFSLPNVLFATAACNFWTLELQKWLRDCGVLCILTYKCASRHSAVPFFTCLLNSCLRTRRFSEATFRTETTNHWKNTAIRNVPNISRTCTVTLHARWSSSTRVLIFLLTWHLYSAFQLCILSEVRLLNFLRWNMPTGCFEFGNLTFTIFTSISHLPNLASPPAAGAADSARFEAGEATWAFRLHPELGSSKEVKEPDPIFLRILNGRHP